MKKIITLLNLFLVMLIVGFGLNGCSPDSNNDKIKNKKVKVDFGSKVKIKGVVACLPKKGDGPHTMECTYGIKTDSIYYGLKKVPHRALENGLLQKGKNVIVHGTALKPDSASTYKMVAVIKIDTITLANRKGTQDWKQVHEEQFTMQILSHWKSGHLFAERWSSLSSQIEGDTLFAVHTPNGFLQNTNFGGLQITVGKSNLEKAVVHCLSPLENRAGAKRRKATINNVQFTVIQVKDAATGDRYVTTSYRTKHNNACWAIETVLNYAPIEFYGKESGVTEFNRQKVKEEIQAIIHTFDFKKPLHNSSGPES